MGDLVDFTAEPGEVGWHVVDAPHRCSRKHCGEPAVIYYLGRTYGYGGVRAHWRRRFACGVHMNEYTDATPWQVIDGRLVRPKYDFERERDGEVSG
jgi:hypothetical protein